MTRDRLAARRGCVIRTWPNQTEISVSGLHFVQEDSPQEVGETVADFVQRLRRA
jgi:haloalkane dehalogenase